MTLQPLALVKRLLPGSPAGETPLPPPDRLAAFFPAAAPGLRQRLFPKRRPALVFDPARCTGCGLCETACSARDTGQAAPHSSRIQIVPGRGDRAVYAVYCQHCRDPLCLAACPQRAVSKGEDGVVRVDQRLCVHCGLCREACAGAAPRRMPDGKIGKCDLCGGAPKCLAACPNQALAYSPGKALGWIRLIRWPVQALSFLLLAMILTGSICSLAAGEFSLACPLGVLQNIFSSKLVIVSTVAAGLVLMALALLGGRIFCGFLCPFGFVLDLCAKLIPKRYALPGFLRARAAKYGVAASALGVSAVAGYQAFCTVCPIGTVCRAYGFQSVVGGAELAIIPAIAALEVSEKRSWCRYFCPVGALFALAAKIGLVKIVIGAERCKKFSCMRCADACPMGIVSKDDLGQGVSPKLPMDECILCMRCIDSCPHGAALIRFAWQKATPAERRGCPGRQAP